MQLGLGVLDMICSDLITKVSFFFNEAWLQSTRLPSVFVLFCGS